MQNQTTHLFKTEGSSDKQYNVHLEARDGGWVVYGMNGRRGSTLKAQPKTEQPLDYDAAKVIFDKLVASKKKGGYTEDASGAAYVGTEHANRATDARPQLLVPVSEDRIERLLTDPAWCLEPKLDGERRLVDVDGTSLVGINRKGLTVPLSSAVAVAVAGGAFSGGLTRLDGEDLGERYGVWDVLSFEGRDLRAEPYATRLRFRAEVLARAPGLLPVVTACTTQEKRDLLAHLIASNMEGAVFKRLDASYVAGDAHDVALKFKFVADASVRVLQPNVGKRSVGMELLDPQTGLWSFVGNVTIPANAPIPAAGSILDVRYLYAFPNGGSLFQPVYWRKRTDIDASACVIGQLKYKGAAALEQAA